MSGQPAQAAAALDKTPRPITPRAAWRAWAEMPVQFWWKAALAIAVVAAYVTGSQLSDAFRLRWMLSHGLPVEAKIVELNGRKLTTGSYHPLRDTELPVKLEGRLPDGQSFHYDGWLPTADDYAALGGTLAIRVDPKDATHWLEDKPPRSWWHEFTGLFMLLPVALLLLAFAWWRRRQILQVWRDGKAVEGSIVSCTHSPIAPRSKVCGYSVPGDRRVFKMLYPLRLGQPRVGDVVPLIVLPDRPDRAIAARAYQT